MTIMSDKWIRQQCTDPDKKPMIVPYHESSISHTDGMKHPSFGSSSYGYDIRIGRNFKILKSPQSPNDLIDTRSGVPEHFWTNVEADNIIIQPGQCVLGHSEERVSVPRDVSVVCMAKSTIARIFLQACVTPLEAGWEGYITIELFNPTCYPIRLWAGDGIMQMLFIKGDQPCDVSYADRGGKYQNQEKAPVPSRFLDAK